MGFILKDYVAEFDKKAAAAAAEKEIIAQVNDAAEFVKSEMLVDAG